MSVKLTITNGDDVLGSFTLMDKLADSLLAGNTITSKFKLDPVSGDMPMGIIKDDV